MSDIHSALEVWAKANGNREYTYDDVAGLVILDGKERPDLAQVIIGYDKYVQANEYIEKRKLEYPSIPDQLDMIYHDMMDNTSIWKDTITGIKNKYPKPKE